MKLTFKHIRIIVILIVISVSCLFVQAQSHLVFYQTTEQFNSSNYNPAFLVTQEKFTFSIFPFAGMNVSYNNQAVINSMIKNVFKKNTSEETSKEVSNELFNSLVEKGIFYQRFESNLLHVGYNNPEYGSFNFRVREIEQLLINFKGDFTEFILNASNKPLYIGQWHYLPAKALHYREYSLGYAKEIIQDKLTVGLRAKLYFGKATFVSDLYGGAMSVNDTISLQSKGELNLSAPVKTLLTEDDVLLNLNINDNFSIGSYIFNKKNIGTGIDLGLNYQINHNLILSASIIDLGSIKWKNNLRNFEMKGISEIDQTLINSTGDKYITNTPDFVASMVDNFNLFMVDTLSTQFSTSLPTNYYLGLSYQINQNLSIGIVDRFIQTKGLNHNSISLTSKIDLKKKLTITTGYSIIGKSYFNIPFGILYKWNAGQSFIGSDNIFSFLLPSFSDVSGITFGTCFYLFRKKEKYREQQEYLPFYKEKKK